MSQTLLRHGNLLDVRAGTYRESIDVLVEGNIIREISDRPIKAVDAHSLDVSGCFIMPGLIDAHVHVIGVTLDVNGLARMPPYFVAAQAKGVLEAMLMRGFTTVRDAGGANWGLAEAVRQGYFVGPRIFVSGLALAQTGGQGDFRVRGQRELGCPMCRGERTLTRVVDGAQDVRKAVREELKEGADQIKVMASGGMASGIPTYRPQFAMDELRAMVDEAGRCNTYVMAHAYESEAIARCLAAGIRSIEHGSSLDQATAKMMVDRSAFLVPTLSVYSAFLEHGLSIGYSASTVATFGQLLKDSLESLSRAHALGVKIAQGSDLEGEMHRLQSREFLLKAEVLSAREVVASATITNAELLNMTGRLGVVAEGALADILVVDGNPLKQIGVLADPDRHLRVIMKDGIIYKSDV